MQRVNYQFMDKPITLYITEIMMSLTINALGRANIDLVVTTVLT